MLVLVGELEGVTVGVTVDEIVVVGVDDNEAVFDGDAVVDAVWAGVPVAAGVADVDAPTDSELDGVKLGDADDDNEAVLEADGVLDGVAADVGVCVDVAVGNGVSACHEADTGAKATPRKTFSLVATPSTTDLPVAVTYRNSLLVDVAYSTKPSPVSTRPVTDMMTAGASDTVPTMEKLVTAGGFIQCSRL